MARVDHYRQTIKALLKEYALAFSDGQVETQLVFDEVHDHYQLVDVGWRNEFDRVYGAIVHVDIRDGKIWVQRDMTESGVANELVERGISKDEIVLGFQAPFKRPYTEFAVA